jgi:hypothetical protein
MVATRLQFRIGFVSTWFCTRLKSKKKAKKNWFDEETSFS